MLETRIGHVKIGDGHPTAFMAELGTFYNQNIEKALDFVDLAAEAECAIIKTEILHDANVMLPSALTHQYNHATGSSSENYRELIERKTVPLSAYEKIIRKVKDKNLPFAASVYDRTGADFLADQGGDAIKLWRNNYNNFPFIEYVAKKELPIIFDAANVYLDEIAKAVRVALASGAPGVIVNYHPGINPALAEDHHLQMIPYYKKTLDVPVGLSCHYRGDEILYAAVGLGVNIIEKGVFDNPEADEQNVMTAAAFDELKEIVQKVKNCSTAIGKAPYKVKEPRDFKLHYGLVAQKNISKGEMLDESNTRFAMPLEGIDAQHWDLINGKTISFSIEEGKPIPWSAIEF